MIQSDGLGLILTDDGLGGCLGGLGLGCLGLGFDGVVLLVVLQHFAGVGTDGVVVLVVASAEVDFVFLVILFVFNDNIGGLGGGDASMIQSDGFCLVLADDGLGSLGGFGCLSCLLGCLGGLFGGLLGGGGLGLHGAVILLLVLQHLAGGHVDGVVVFVVIVAELHIVLAVFLVIFDLGLGGLLGGDACMLQSDLQGLVLADGGGLVSGDLGGGFGLFVDDCLGGGFSGGLDIERSRLHGGRIGSGAAGGQEQCEDQSENSDGLFHGSRLLSDYFCWLKNRRSPPWEPAEFTRRIFG